MLQGFKKFLFRGNVVDLAVAVVIGAAFGAVVTSLVTNVFTPLIAAIGGKPDFSNLSVTINHSKVMYGSFLNALISFVMIAAAVYFFIVAPLNTILERRKKGESPPDPSTRKCPECLSEIPIAARRCAFCASIVGTAATAAAGK
jgi:large conductance mechanosensitive channel